MKVLHLIAAGDAGGVQTLIKEYASLSELDNIYTFAWGGGFNEEHMRNHGARTICFDAHRDGTFRTGLKLVSLFIKEKPGAVVVHTSPFLRYAASWMHRIDRTVRVYFYCHADIRFQVDIYRGLKKAVYNYINRLCIRHCEKVIAISQYVKRTMMEFYHVPADRIEVIYNAANVEAFNVPAHVPGETVRFVYTGRLVEEKGVQISLQALARLPEQISWEFHIVGEGPFGSRLEKLADELGIGRKVIFHGSCSNIPDILAEMDIFLHTCIWEEGFGIGIIEAMAAGKLCICSHSGAIPEIIHDGIDGFLVEKNNTEQLTKCLMKVLDRKEDWEPIRQAARKTAGQYNVGKFAEALDRLLGQPEETAIF